VLWAIVRQMATEREVITLRVSVPMLAAMAQKSIAQVPAAIALVMRAPRLVQAPKPAPMTRAAHQ
jgi:hypothetical protein